MKILVLGDIHGRNCWTNIVANEPCDKVIFLGDYVSTHDRITEEEQIVNLDRILTYKTANPDKVILLRGNHDLQHLDYDWAECSGYFKKVADYMVSIKDKFLENTQWIYIYNNILFSHAGISAVWLGKNKLEDINNMKPSEYFGFTPDNIFDNYGASKTQPLTWIRPQILCECNIKDYTQVVGHTPVRVIGDIYKATKYHEHIWLCDNLPNQYLIIEDNNFIVKDTDKEEIVLPNRYNSVNKLIKVKNGLYRLECNNYNYLRIIGDKTITALDPDGGPFMSIGGEVCGKQIENIYSKDNNFYLELSDGKTSST